MLLQNILLIILLATTTQEHQNLFNVYFPPEKVPPVYYTDEILPICIVGPPNTSFELQVVIKNSAGELIQEFIPEKPLIQSNSIYCCAIEDLPPIKGYFIAEIKISNNNYSNIWKIPFCRIERISPESKSIFGVIEPSQDLLPLLRLYWLDEISISAESSQIQNIAQTAVSQGYELTVEFDPSKFSSPIDTFEHIYSQINAYVNKWDFKSIKNKSLLVQAFQLITKNPNPSKISISLDTLNQLSDIEDLFTNTEQIEINWCGKLEFNDIQNLMEKLIEITGEKPKISISLSTSNFPSNPAEQLQELWELLTLNPTKIKFSSSLLFQDENPTILIPSIFAISKLWQPDLEFVGWYVNEPSLKVCVFSSPQNWLMAFWGEQPITLKGETLATTQGFDINSNPIPLPSLTNSTLTLDAQQFPTYLVGTCYNVVIESAKNYIKTLSEKILNSQLINALPPSIIDGIKSISKNPEDSENRVRLLSIFRFLPEYEKSIITNPNWDGKASLLTYQLYDFLRKSCILQQAKSEPFREPFLDIKTRCEEYITSFLTGSSTALEKDKRTNLIMKEVNKILELADKTSSSGRRIEASALLYLAEGMALSLIEHLKTTPLMLAEDKIPKRNISKNNTVEISSSSSQTAQTPPIDRLEDEKTYTVVAGDTIEKISKKFGITPKQLLLANNLTEKSKLRIGQKIKIPTTQKESTQTPEQPIQKELTTPSPEPSEKETGESQKEIAETSEVLVYKIQPGDIPAKIAQKFGIAPEELMKFNNIKDPTKLRVGQELKIPKSPTKTDSVEDTSSSKESRKNKEKEEEKEKEESPTSEQSESSDNIIHIVQKGDNPYTIAKKYGVSTESILKANNLTPKSVLQIGQKLIIPKPKKNQ